MKRLLFALAVLVLPCALFAKGEVVGYAAGWANAPSDAQLDRVTHIMVFQILPESNGSLNTDPVPSWLGNLVQRAHNKGKKVSIAVGGWTSESPTSWSYAQAAGASRAAFVNNLVNFVNSNGLDGIDIDWEYPQGAEGWNNFISLCSDLKQRLPGKRISAAVSGETPTNSSFPGNVRSGIWNALDAIHIMSYDMRDEWPTHSDAGKSKQLIAAWASWGNGQPGFSKEKLLLGCAFYGYSGNNQIPYNQGGGTGCDTPNSLKDKVDYCQDNGYGGVLIWELSHDTNISTTPTLLSAIWNANQAKGGYNPGGGAVQTHTITASAGSGGSISPNGNVTVNDGASQTFTITPNNGKIVEDVKVNGTSVGAKLSHTFTNVKGNATISVTFKDDDGSGPEIIDLADGDWEWEKIIDDENLGSLADYNVAPANVSFTLKAGISIEEAERWAYAEIACFSGGIWTGVTGVTITYTSNQPILLTLQDNIGLGEEGRGYNYRLNSGNNVTVTIPITQFKHYESDWETETNLLTSQLGIFEGVSISPADENVTVTGSIKVLRVNGLIVEDDTPIIYNERKTVSAKSASGASLAIVNGNINLSLPAGANNANIVLFDVRGRILFERSVAVSGNVASVALPKDILHNQVAILRVRTNTGFNLTKRVLIK